MFKKFILYPLVFICITACSNNFYQVPVAQGNIVTDDMIKQLEKRLNKCTSSIHYGLPCHKNSLILIDGTILECLVMEKMKPLVFIMFCTSRKAN